MIHRYGGRVSSGSLDTQDSSLNELLIDQRSKTYSVQDYQDFNLGSRHGGSNSATPRLCQGKMGHS